VLGSVAVTMPRSLLVGAALLACIACDPSSEGGGRGAERSSAERTLPATARADLIEMLREDAALRRHASDGGGHARLVSGDDPAKAGRPGMWTFRYEAGEHGIAEGGMLFFQPPPFWGWSPPQAEQETAPGFTTVTTDAPGITLAARAVDQGLLAATVRGRAMVAGETITVTYGAGPAGALADRYAERGSAFWFGVDGDGDGIRGLVPDPPRITITAGPAARLVAHWPSVARPGEEVRLTIAALDASANTGCVVDGPLIVTGTEDMVLPSEIHLGDGGRVTVMVTVPREGIHRLRIRSPSGLDAETNPLEVSSSAPRILWGDFHGHSNYSDGTGLPEDYYVYARDVAALDVAALSDHDHWGLEFLDAHPRLWRELRDVTRRMNEPGRFVTLLAFEWTSWAWGHRHVVYFGDDGPLVSSLAEATDHPTELWRALDGQTAITIAHHPAGGPIAIDWSIPPDPRFEPVTEVSSVHGSSEAEDSPQRIYSPIAGHFVRDALDRGYRLGFVGSGDSHDGHPGLVQLVAGTGGLAAVLSDERSREGVLSALRARRTYATNGARIILRFSLDDTAMGGTLPPPVPEAPDHAVAVRVIGTAPLERIDLVRSGAVAVTVEVEGEREVSWTTAIPPLGAGEYVYVRVVQRDGGLAWSSPIYPAAAASGSSKNTRTSRSSERR